MLDILEKHNLSENVNVIFTADHGMAAVTNVVNLGNYLDLKDPAIEMVGFGQVLQINVLSQNTTKMEKVFDAVRRLPNGTAYKKADIPDRLRYKNHPFTPDILVVPSEGTLFVVVCSLENSNKSGIFFVQCFL